MLMLLYISVLIYYWWPDGDDRAQCVPQVVTSTYGEFKGSRGPWADPCFQENHIHDGVDVRSWSKKVWGTEPFWEDVEIISEAINSVIQPIFNLGGELKIRYGTGKVGPVISDNGNVIGDVYFQKPYDPVRIEKELNNIPGIIENGLFPRGAHRVIIGNENEIDMIVRDLNTTTKQ